MHRLIPLVVCGLLSLPASTSAQKRGLIPPDYYKEVTVSEVATSPAGDYVAFTVTTVVEKDNKRHREIWMQRLKNGAPDGKPFRFTDPIEESSGARWAPDGNAIAFTSRRGKDTNNVWFVRMTAPGGEAYHVDGVAGPPSWSRDGKWIAFVKQPESGEAADDEAKDKTKREGWIAPNSVSKTVDAKRFDGRVITSTRYKRDGTLTLLPHYSIEKKSQLFVVSSEGGEAKPITTLPYSVRSVEWAADNATILFTGNEREDEELNDELSGDIFAISREGGEPRRLTGHPGTEASPAVSPDGKRLAFLQTKERGGQNDVMVVDIAPDGRFEGQPRNVTSTWDLAPTAPWWTPAGTALRFEAGVGGNQHLFEAAVDGQTRQVTQGDRWISDVSASRDGSVIAFAASDPLMVSELFVARGDGSGEARATTLNDAWLSELTLVKPERLTWKVADGTEIEGWLVKPVGYTPGRKYPLVLKIHGGPHGAYGNTWFGTFPILSNAGFFVLYPNPRGSTGYGHKFTYATRGKWGEMDQEDFLKGVDTALAKYPDIDPTRLGVSGGSYGGYMTNWLTSRTTRFAAAVTSRSIANWESWYGTSDAQGLTEYEFFGKPWEQREVYRRLSPISSVENVKAPTLIIMQEEDWRTPLGDSEQWFMALMKRKVPTELVRYPRSSHGLSRTGEPWLLVDRLERIRSWFVYWLIEKPASTSTP
jgi:dipeptidyl aminopeptidase/acylaminoacyl peptidase